MTRILYWFVCMAMALGLFCAPAAAQGFAPRNECEGYEDAQQFRIALVTAVANRNEDLLRSLVHDHTLLDFGGSQGWDTLRTRLDDPDYALWDELEAVLGLGCALREDGSMTMPYYFAQDIGELDAYAAHIALGENVPVYGDRQKSAILRSLDWEFVELAAFYEASEEPHDAAMREVLLGDGSRGFVAAEQLRGLIDYRLGAEKREGRWVIAFLVAGD